jgi:hypothetical protein
LSAPEKPARTRKSWVGRIFSFPGEHKTAFSLAFAVLAAFFVVLVWHPWRAGDQDEASQFPAGGPAEFLYLDRARVIAYLAQMEGGTFTTETLTSKLAKEGNGKLAVEGLGEIGGSVSEENSLARDLTPTSAADYFAFLRDLKARHGLDTIGLGRFEKEVAPMKEGQFVLFDTHELRPPVYVNPYLAVRTSTVFDAIYPAPQHSRFGAERARRQRRRARHFEDLLGKNPRIVFALRPYDKQELRRIERGEEARPKSALELRIREEDLRRRHPREGRARAAERQKLTRRRAEEARHVIYLMPMNARLLTRERSLLKYGGGEFTVVGKVVRVFPEHGEDNHPAYIDSPTVETWEQPLAHAPAKLLCSSDPRCAREENEHRGRQRSAIHDSRQRDLGALEEETRISQRGAVILPIAIYK